MPGYLEFEVSLREIRPRIWRRFQLAGGASFGDLHRAIRDSFGWHGGHLWDFQDARRRVIAGVDTEYLEELDESPPDAEEIRLKSYFPAARSAIYLYDFGDGWEHSVTLRDGVSMPDRFHRRLLAGRRACPPEDCGGVPGYYRFVSVVETGVDPWDEDVTELREWLDEWHPSAFDFEEVRHAFDSTRRLPAEF